MALLLPITLCAAAAAALINLWLSVRIGQLRRANKAFHGDDAGGPLTRRMRAQLNFVENTPLVLILIAGIEIAGRGNAALAGIAGLYALARVAHAIGMDSENFSRLRFVGTLVTMIVQLALAIWAVGIALRVF